MVTPGYGDCVHMTLRQEMEYHARGKDLKNQLQHAHTANKDDMTNIKEQSKNKNKVNLVVQLGLDIKDSVQLGLSQNNAPWVLPGSHM